MKDKKILVIDDDASIRESMQRVFTKEGAQVITAADGQQGLRQLYLHHPDLVILDILMPILDGWETCRQIRLMSDVPIILLTSLQRDEDLVRGLDYGADDFVTKPFRFPVLLARVRAVLRRSESLRVEEHASIYSDEYLLLDFQKRKVIAGGREVKLTPTEFRLLTYLFHRSEMVCTYEQILENVWGWEYRDSIDYVHVYISHIRQNIEENPRNPAYILSERGVGYRFEKKR